MVHAGNPGMDAKRDFSNLFSPFRLRDFTLRNRVQITSHGTFNIDENGAPDAREAAYWAERAKGGAALCIMGTHLVHPSSPFNIGQFKNWGDYAIPGLEMVAGAVHEHGALLLAQIGHMGQRVIEAKPCWGPSAVSWHARPFGITPHAMTKAEIAEVIQAYADTAARCVNAGFDGVELAVGHGQLINTFLSPVTNHRDDEYGGALPNRMRFALQVIDAIRQKIGSRPILGFRINATDRTPEGLEEVQWLEIAGLLDGLGAGDYFNISMDFTGSIIPTCLHPGGVFMPWARRVKERVSLPVFSTGRITDPELAEQILARGDVDVVGMTRAHIADPHLLLKLSEGRRDDIRPCIGCLQMCVGEIWRASNVKCVYNPITGRETGRSATFAPAARPRRVTIVGAGPAGLEAARVAASQGHVVTVLERSDRAGGAFARYAAGAARQEFARATQWLETQALKAGATVRFGVSADAQTVAATAPDAIVLATGATARLPRLTSRRITHIRDLLDDAGSARGHVVILDSEYGAGVSAATTLSARGDKVTVLAGSDGFGPLMEFNMRDDLMSLARAQGVEFISGVEVAAATDADASVTLVLRDVASAEQRVLVADLLAATAAGAADPALEQACRHAVPAAQVFVIGDADAPARMEQAIEAAYTAAMTLSAPEAPPPRPN